MAAMANSFAVFLVLVALAFQAWVTYRVVRSPLFDPVQKRRQTKLIWLVPVFGAAIVFSVISSEEEHERPKKEQRR